MYSIVELKGTDERLANFVYRHWQYRTRSENPLWAAILKDDEVVAAGHLNLRSSPALLSTGAVDELYRGQKLQRQLIDYRCERAKQYLQDVVQIDVHKDNHASLKNILACGFKVRSGPNLCGEINLVKTL